MTRLIVVLDDAIENNIRAPGNLAQGRVFWQRGGFAPATPTFGAADETP